ncbi:MAG: helicase DnaB [Cyanobium sp.]
MPRARAGVGVALAGLLAGAAVAHQGVDAFYRPALPSGAPTSSSGSSAIEWARALPSEGMRPDPVDFSSDELRELNRRFGVHGPQPPLAQLFTAGIDSLQPLRSHTLGRLEELQPVILSEARRQGVNPMLLTAVLFDELQHAKPGENTPLAANSGLFHTHGPAQLSVSELVKQGLLPAEASPDQLEAARLELLDPDRSVTLLASKFVRLSKDLHLHPRRLLMASASPHDAKALATLAYLHNGKLDYPARILRYMQDPELHALIYGSRRHIVSPLI